MSRVAITGGLGFIGSHLAEAFTRLGWAVSIIDDDSGSVVGAGFDAFDDMHIMDAGRWAAKMSQAQAMGMPDLVVHCASPVGPGLVSTLGGTIAPEIIRVTHEVGEACAFHEIPLVHISSSEVYGAPPWFDEDEIDEPYARATEEWPVGHVGYYTARSEYGLAKAVAENMLANIPDLKHACIRPFNTVGRRQAASKGFVLPTFIEQVKAGEPLTVYEPNAIRALTSVHDLCEFVTQYWPIIVLQGGIWNVANPNTPIAIWELAQLVINVHIAYTGEDGSWVEVDPVDRWGIRYAFFGQRNGAKVPNADKAMSLGWEPGWNLRDIVTNAYVGQK